VLDIEQSASKAAAMEDLKNIMKSVELQEVLKRLMKGKDNFTRTAEIVHYVSL
jgi:hypothetical protein